MTPSPNFTFTNATVFTGTEVLANASVRIANGRIQDVFTGAASTPDAVDLQGQWLVPGFIDLQLYGGSDHYLNQEPTAETVRHIYDTHRQNGTTSVMPTLYSTSHTTILRAIEAVRTAQQTNPLGVLGLHVEGPYLNPIRRGAHSLNYVRQPNETEIRELLTVGRDVIRMMTIAPECFTDEQLSWFINSGWLLSAGHTDATYRQATDAFDRLTDTGEPVIGLATHLYNAMRGFESREPGVVGAVFDHATVKASIIADGFHCDPVAIRLAHRLLPNRLFLISDATFAHPPRPSLAFEDFIIEYHDGRYTNQEGKLAGSSITLLDAVKVCVEQAGLSPADAFRMAATLPAEIIGLGGQLGKIQLGYVANLVVLDQSLTVQQVITA